MEHQEDTRRFMLIGGLPRSGTTLIQTVVGSHSRIAIPPGDFPFAQQTARGLSVTQIFSIHSKKQTWELWHLDDVSFVLDLDHGAAFEAVLYRFAEEQDKDIPGAKAPHSEFFIDDYRRWLPDHDLKFIHVIRNPFDVIASLRRSHIHTNWHGYTDLVEVQCRNWIRSASLGLARSHSEPDHFYIVHYEDLVAEPEKSAAELCEFLGVSFEKESMLNRSSYSYHDTNTSFPAEFAAREDKDTYIYKPKSRKTTLSSKELKLVGRICGELARSIGYEDPDLRTAGPGQMGKVSKMTRARRLPGRIYRKVTR